MVDALMRQGKTKQQAYAIATSQLQKSKVLKPGTQKLEDMGRSAVKAARKKFAPKKRG